MNNTYIIKKASLKQALDHIDDFKTKMETFKEKHPQYIYSVMIEKDGEEYRVEINIKTKNEDTQTSKRTARSRSVL